MPEMNHHHCKRKHLLIIRHGNCQKLFARYTATQMPYTFIINTFYNTLTVRFLMYRNTFCVCCGPLIISGKQAASWDVIRSCGSLLWKAAPSTPTIKRQVVYKHCKGTTTWVFFFTLLFLAKVSRIAMRWHGSWFHDMLSLSSFVSVGHAASHINNSVNYRYCLGLMKKLYYGKNNLKSKRGRQNAKTAKNNKS